MWDFLVDRREQFLVNAWNHAYLVILAVLFATIIAIVLAVLVVRIPKLEPVANAISAIGLTIPSMALIGLLLPLTKLGAGTALVAVAFYAVFPILRNAVVGLRGVSPALLESARGMGMSEAATFFRIRLPLAWPVILSGIRVSVQMSMGVAAIAALVLGPGLGGWIYQGLMQNGSKNAIDRVLSATIGIVVLALILDALLLLLGRLTTSKGVRV